MSVHTRHGRPHVRLGVTLGVAAGMTKTNWWHGGDIGVGIALRHLAHGHHILHLLLPLVLKIRKLLLIKEIL